MGAAPSILGQCADCCVCAAPVLEAKSRTAFTGISGYSPFVGEPDTRLYKYLTVSGMMPQNNLSNEWDGVWMTREEVLAGSIIVTKKETPADLTATFSGATVGFNPLGRDLWGGGFDLALGGGTLSPGDEVGSYWRGLDLDGVLQATNCTVSPLGVESCPLYGLIGWNEDGTELTYDWVGRSGAWLGTWPSSSVGITFTLSGLLGTADAQAQAIAAMPAGPSDWLGQAVAALSVDHEAGGLSISGTESLYRFRHPLPKLGSGTSYVVRWSVRRVAGPVLLDSVATRRKGCFLPDITLDVAPAAGGEAAVLRAVMGPTGRITAIRVLNPGRGYAATPAPKVRVESLSYPGANPFTVVLGPAGEISAVTGADNFFDSRPVLTLPAGTNATLSRVMDEDGGVTVSLASPGTVAREVWSLVIEPTTTLWQKAPLVVDLHYGEETPMCAAWGGGWAGDYSDVDPDSWPVLAPEGEEGFSLGVPEEEGAVMVDHLRAECEGESVCE